MKNLLFFSILLYMFSGCKNVSNESINGSDLDSGAVKLLIPYVDSNFKEQGAVSDSIVTHEIVKNLPACVIPTLRSQLQSYKTVTKTYNGKDDAGISIPGFAGLKLGKEEISYSVYYVEPNVVTCDTTKKVYGIGYSMHLRIKKLKRGLSLDKLPYIAASVQIESGKTEVYFSMQSYGLAGLPLVKFFKPVVNKPFDVEGFNNMQSSIDGIHSSLGDSTLSSHLKFTPQELTFLKASDL